MESISCSICSIQACRSQLRLCCSATHSTSWEGGFPECRSSSAGFNLREPTFIFGRQMFEVGTGQYPPAKLTPMKALVITSLSGPGALAVRDMPEPALKPGQTLVRVAAGGLNFADFMTAQGGYPGTPAPPLIAGREFAGVEASTGRRVMGYIQWAAFAERVAAHANMLWPVPEHWTDE